MKGNDLHTRALAAYFRGAGAGDGVVMQPSAPEDVVLNGLRYIVLSNVNGILAVYRVRIVNDEPMLKGLKRWPKQIDEQFAPT